MCKIIFFLFCLNFLFYICKEYCYLVPAEGGESGDILLDGGGRLGEWDGRKIVRLTLGIVKLDTSEVRLIVNFSEMIQKMLSAPKCHSAHSAWNEVM